jgi:uncharacterized protein (TIGR02246 family)
MALVNQPRFRLSVFSVGPATFDSTSQRLRGVPFSENLADVIAMEETTMQRRARFVCLAGALVIGAGLYHAGTTRSGPARAVIQAAGQPPAAQVDAKADPAKQAVLANVRTFTDAFNKQDVAALLKLFADDCELTEHDGTTIRGLKELEEQLQDSFDADPKARLSVSVDFLRMVTPDVIVEEGKTMFYPDGTTLTAETDYQATHVKKGDRWLMSRVRTFNREVLSPYDQLRELEWLVGEWVDESSDSLVETKYHWDANKVFLLQEFSIRVKGQRVLSGNQRIGRDPLTKQIKAWVFDSEGGYAESLWSAVDDSWVIKATGVRADGKVVTVTNQLTQIGKDRMRFESIDRIVGEERMPGLTAVVVRKPPQATR